METFTYVPRGVCSTQYVITVDNENNQVKNIEIKGGCPGNLLGISRIIKGMDIDQVIESFSGVPCGMTSTSCPDQIAQALKAYKAQKA